MKRTILALLALSISLSAQQFQHIVIVIQENRTPDNLFGSNPYFEPGVDLATSGLSGTQTIQLASIPLDECYDIPHSLAPFRKQYNKGAMNGFNLKLRGKKGCILPPYPEYRYVDNSDGTVQPYFDIAMSGGWANRFFQTDQSASFPGHQFLISGTSAISDTSDVLVAENAHNGSRGVGCLAPPDSWVYTIDDKGKTGKTYPCFSRSSMLNLLDEAHLTWRYYSPNAQVAWNAPLALAEYYDSPNIILKPPVVLTDIQNCNLANVVWVTPSSYYSDHPGGTSTGPQWVSSIVNTVFNNPKCPNGETYWQNTAILITWDDWGGWYDHVPPPPSSSSCPDVFCMGFRVPFMVVSPYTPPGYVSNTTLDFGSILRFVEENFQLPCLAGGQWADCTSPGLSEFFTGQQRQPAKIRAKPFVSNGRDDEDPDTD
ncbi:MAG TPA: alkaline phosphatase family protein [Terriglobales bacterium]|nr:alkaline phosphatase family protein [Terriglobales bacterium]